MRIRIYDVIFATSILVVIIGMYMLMQENKDLGTYMKQCVYITPNKDIENNNHIIIQDGVMDRLEQAYNKENEFFFCLNGTATNDTIYVDEVINTTIYITMKTTVSADVDTCRFGTIHSHPGTCNPSQQDIYDFGLWSEKNAITIDMIYCGDGFYAFYYKNSTNWRGDKYSKERDKNGELQLGAELSRTP